MAFGTDSVTVVLVYHLLKQLFYVVFIVSARKMKRNNQVYENIVFQVYVTNIKLETVAKYIRVVLIDKFALINMSLIML
jgi:hypothetical protein